MFFRLHKPSLIWPGVKWLAIFVLGAGFAISLSAQTAAIPTVAFSLDFPNSEPEHYDISVASDGHSVYRSNGKLTDQSEGDPFRLEFQMSQATSARIFDLAAQAHHFEGSIDSGKKNLASTGAKTLSYTEGARNTTATYNYSFIPAVQQLTEVFQNLSMTLEFGRRLEFYHHYQKLALDDELKEMERESRDKNLAELSAIAPILKTIAQDTKVMRTARARASRFLEHLDDAATH